MQVVSPEGSALGHVTMDDLLVARLHDLNEDTLRTRHFVAFGRQRPVAGDATPARRLHRSDAAELVLAARSTTTMSLSR